MNGSATADGPLRYRLHVAGHLDHHWSAWFGGVELIRQDDGTTTLAALVSDQPELHELLAKIRDLGVTLISVAAVDPDDARIGRP